MRENNPKDKNMPSEKGMEGGLTIRTYRCGGVGGGEGKRILRMWGGGGGGGEEDFKNYT